MGSNSRTHTPVSDETTNERIPLRGENIRRFRKREGLSVNDLAELVGVGANHLSKMERGNSNGAYAPTTLTTERTIMRICDVLGVTPAEIYGGEPSAEPPAPVEVFDQTAARACVNARVAGGVAAVFLYAIIGKYSEHFSERDREKAREFARDLEHATAALDSVIEGIEGLDDD